MQLGGVWVSLSGRYALDGRLSIIRIRSERDPWKQRFTASINQGGPPMTHDMLKWLLSTAAAVLSLAFVALLENL